MIPKYAGEKLLEVDLAEGKEGVSLWMQKRSKKKRDD